MAMNFPYGNRSQAFAATSAFPLDARTYFESYDAALAAAAKAKPVGDSSTSYYFGQHVAVVEMIENVPQNAKLYIIAPVEDAEGALIGTLQEVGSATDGDGKSIELVDGVLSVKNFGKRFYKYIPATETEAAQYELVEVSTENPWKSGLQPRIDADGSIAWYEPNPTTIEGVQDQVTGIQGDVEQAQKDIDAVEENLVKAEEKIDSINDTLYGTEGEEAVKGLVDKVADLEKHADDTDKEITDLWDAVDDTYTKEEVDGLVSGVFHYKGVHEGEYADLPSLTAKIGDVWQIGDKEYAWNGEAWIELGFTIDLSAYATKEYVNTEVKKVQDEVDAAEGRLDAHDTAIEGINGRLDGHDTAVEDINGRLDGHDTAIGEAEDRLDLVEEAVDGLNTTVGTLRTDLNNLGTTVGTLRSDVDGLADRMDDAESAITTLDTSVGTLNNELADLKAVVGASSTGSTSSLFSAVEILQTRIDGLVATGGEANILNGIAINGVNVAIDEATKIANLPIFAGSTSGLVPVASEIVQKAPEEYFLNAAGQWSDALASKIYVDEAVAEAMTIWEPIAE